MLKLMISLILFTIMVQKMARQSETTFVIPFSGTFLVDWKETSLTGLLQQTVVDQYPLTVLNNTKMRVTEVTHGLQSLDLRTTIKLISYLKSTKIYIIISVIWEKWFHVLALKGSWRSHLKHLLETQHAIWVTWSFIIKCLICNLLIDHF